MIDAELAEGKKKKLNLEAVFTCPNLFCLDGDWAGKVQGWSCADIKEEFHLVAELSREISLQSK